MDLNKMTEKEAVDLTGFTKLPGIERTYYNSDSLVKSFFTERPSDVARKYLGTLVAYRMSKVRETNTSLPKHGHHLIITLTPEDEGYSEIFNEDGSSNI